MSISDSDFQFVRELLVARSGIVLEPGKEYLLEARLGPFVRDLGVPDVSGVIGLLRRSRQGELATRVVDALTTNETSFFRDAHPFDSLRTTIVPELIRRNASTRTLRIWSAACSTGQEPYSIGMVLLEHFPELASWNVRILATDLAETVLARARAGRYRQLEVNRGLPASYLAKYFERDGLEWKVVDALRQKVEVRALNLIGDWGPMPRFDVVFLRNVLIYFDVETKRRILARVRQQLQPEGWLFLGSAETTLQIDDSFRRVPIERGQAYRLAA